MLYLQKTSFLIALALSQNALAKDDSEQTATELQRAANIAIYEETRTHLASARYPAMQVSQQRGSEDISAISLSLPCLASVVGKSTFAMARDMVSRGLKPLVLDKANSTSPCGSILEGSPSQEETIGRQSNLCTGLNLAQEKGLFPIVIDGGVLVRSVTFFRDDTYAFVVPFQVDVFASAAFDCNRKHKPEPEKNLAGYDRPESDTVYRQGTKAKIRAFFRAANLNGNDAVVVGSFGCGAFKNDPRLMSRWYNEVLREEEFREAFKEIVFAITPIDSNNFNAFFETFSSTERHEGL